MIECNLYPLDFPTRFSEEVSAFSNCIMVLGVNFPSLPFLGLASPPCLNELILTTTIITF